jgi:hypothetical protein
MAMQRDGRGRRLTPPACSRTEAPAIVRRQKVIDLRMSGLTFDEIAESLDYPDARQARSAYLKAMSDLCEPAHDLRDLELARLDACTKAIWPDVLAGDLNAVTVYLKISAQRAKVAGFERAPIVTKPIDDEPPDPPMLAAVHEYLDLLPGLVEANRRPDDRCFGRRGGIPDGDGP